MAIAVGLGSGDGEPPDTWRARMLGRRAGREAVRDRVPVLALVEPSRGDLPEERGVTASSGRP